MKISFETKGEGENATAAISIEFKFSEKTIEKVKEAFKKVADVVEETKKEGGHSNGGGQES